MPILVRENNGYEVLDVEQRYTLVTQALDLAGKEDSLSDNDALVIISQSYLDQ